MFRRRSAGGGNGRRLADTLAERIGSRIMDGSYRAGDRLPPERELAEQLGANRGSLREALKKLEEMRLVAIQQGSGTRVLPLEQASLELVVDMLTIGDKPNVPWIRDLLDLRQHILPGLAKLCIERGGAAELREFAAHLQRTLDPALGDREFLRELVTCQELAAAMARNRVLLLLHNSLQRFLNRTPGAYLPSGFSPEAGSWDRTPLIPWLRRLAVAAEARDGDAARRATSEILRITGEQLLTRLGEVAGS
ncbi:MAG: FadR/GntR family transcriptional regulator [Myxococcota bacterium]